MLNKVKAASIAVVVDINEKKIFGTMNFTLNSQISFAFTRLQKCSLSMSIYSCVISLSLDLFYLEIIMIFLPKKNNTFSSPMCIAHP